MNTISCPKCGELIEISQALKTQIEEEVLSSERLKHLKELEKVKKEAEEKARKDFEEKNSLELADLKKALAEKEKKVAEFREQELKLREEKRLLEEKEKELALEVQRRVDEERKRTEEEVLRKAEESHRLKDMEKEKVISDLKKALEEAQRKAQQGSQQTQGEVLELDLEETLKSSFPMDLIEPIGKGVRGADIRQTVRSQSGVVCGIILWESKRTKSWTDEWTSKLKEDLRAEGANIPVIVSEVLPKEAQNGIGIKDGVWVTSFSLVLPIAILLRKNLLEVAYQKVASANQGRKADSLYEYITGHEFRQQIEAIVEVYRDLEEEINKERAAFERIWKAREAQAKRLIASAASVYGSIQGRVGSEVLQIKGLELLSLKEGKEEGQKLI